MDLKNLSTAIAIAMTVGGVIWNASSQNSKIEENAKDVKELKERMINVEKIYVKLDYLIHSVDELKKKEDQRVERDREMQLQQIKERDELINTLRSLRR
jgi:hypothetical protein